MSRVGNKHTTGSRFGGDQYVAAKLNRTSRKVDDAVRQAFNFDDRRIRKGGGSIKIVKAKITGYGLGKYNMSSSSLKCKMTDQFGAATGTEFDVWADFEGDTPGVIGMLNLQTDVAPQCNVGGFVDIIKKTNVPHPTVGYVSGWFIFHLRRRFCLK